MDIVNSRCTNKDDQKHVRLRKDWVNLAAILSRSLWFYLLNAEINRKYEKVNFKLKGNTKTNCIASLSKNIKNPMLGLSINLFKFSKNFFV